jgi:hypothetical protein
MIHGSPEAWKDLFDPLVPQIINLVWETWASLSPPAPNELEDVTTRRLCSALQKVPNRDLYRFRISIQNVILSSDSDAITGRQDLSFLPFVADDEIYFCLECKRVRARATEGEAIRAGYSEYVTQGMLRFVRGQYSAAVRQGGMLGYVLDGDIHRAIQGVKSSVDKHRTELRLDPPTASLDASSIRPEHPQFKETRHLRFDDGDGLFVLHHLFVGDCKKSSSKKSSSKKSSSKKASSKKASSKKASSKKASSKKSSSKKSSG